MRLGIERAVFYSLVVCCSLVSFCILSLQPGTISWDPSRAPQRSRHLSNVVESPLPQMGNQCETARFLPAALIAESDVRSSLENFGHFDASGAYKILPYVAVAEDWQQLAKGALCVAVQSSLDRADNLINMTAVWQGAVSFAMLAPGPEFPLAIAYLNYLRRCVPAVRNQVSVHLAYPMKRPPTPKVRVVDEWSAQHQDCATKPDAALRSLLNLRDKQTLKWRNDLQYPQNVLRNVARDHCQSEFVTCPDIDMLLPPGPADPAAPSITQRLNAFLSSQNSEELTAFVFPVFEVATTQPRLPASKAELRALVAAKQARQYHVQVFSANQGLSQLKRWLTIKPSNNYTVSVAFPVDKFKFWYEPVYIARKGTPRFDERYVGFGMVRNTQAYEMSLAGWKFHVMDGVFLSHWGFKKPGESPKVRLRQTENNFQRFRCAHLRELVARYDSDPENLLNKLPTKCKKKLSFKVTK